MERRVVITGLGAVTPIGNNVSEFWDGIKNGKCGIDDITLFDTEGFKVKIAAEVKNFNPEEIFDRRTAKRLDRYSHFALMAAREVMADSKLDTEQIDKSRFGVAISSGIGGLKTMEENNEILNEKGPDRVSPMFIPMTISNMAAGNVSIEIGAQGESFDMATACASATHTIGESYRIIKHGYQDLMMCGGSEASITPLGVAGFANMKALSNANDKTRASIPFDKERSGFVIGEGAGLLLLEEYEHAKNRGAKIYAEIVGYAATSDAYHITSPSPEGEGGAKAMVNAMNEAGITPSDIDYINSHGTSTPLNDKFETIAIKKAFGDAAKDVMISSTKGNTGHLLGAAGGVEAIVAVKAIEDSFVPPTIGYKVPDEECDLDIVPNIGRNKELKYVMSDSLGFGGHNSVIILKKI